MLDVCILGTMGEVKFSTLSDIKTDSVEIITEPSSHTTGTSSELIALLLDEESGIPKSSFFRVTAQFFFITDPNTSWVLKFAGSVTTFSVFCNPDKLLW